MGRSVASPFLEPDVIPGLCVGPAYIISLVQPQVGKRAPPPALFAPIGVARFASMAGIL